MQVDTMVKTALGLATLVGLGGNVYQSNNPVCDDWIEQVEVVRAEGKEAAIRTRNNVMQWVDRVCPRTTSNVPSKAVFASYPFAPMVAPQALGCPSHVVLCPEWPCENDHECLDCICNEDSECG